MSETPDEIRRRIFISRMLREKSWPVLKREIQRLEQAITDRFAAIEKLNRELLDELNYLRAQSAKIAGELNRAVYGREGYAREEIPTTTRVDVVQGVKAEVKTGAIVRYQPIPPALITYYSDAIRRHVTVSEVQEILKRLRQQINSIYYEIENNNMNLKMFQERYLNIVLNYPESVKPHALRELLAQVDELYGNIYRSYARRRARL